MTRLLTPALAACLAAAPLARAGGPVLALTDGCLSPENGVARLSLRLHGRGDRPSSLRTTVLFDPAALEPAPDPDGQVAVPGGALSGWPVVFSAAADAAAGRIDLILNTEGRRPVPPLPEGELARLFLRLVPGAGEGGGSLRVDLDPGQTRSLDGRGRTTFTTVLGPSHVWIGQAGPRLGVSRSGDTVWIGARREDGRAGATIVRGRLRGPAHLPIRGDALEPLATVHAGGHDQAEDQERPAKGEIFFYLATQPDSLGQPLFGFRSDCRDRVRVAARSPGR
ncbi:MAG: hypothetical protein ACE5HD_01675 [Acidobacteriota bacterium]